MKRIVAAHKALCCVYGLEYGAQYEPQRSDPQMIERFEYMLRDGFPTDRSEILARLIDRIRAVYAKPSFENYKVVYVFE